MFKIAKSNIAASLLPASIDIDTHDSDLLTQLSTSETWMGEFSTGVINLKEASAALHGLSSRSCGLLNLIRCYDRKDHDRILELFEEAATLSTSFCFSTTIVMPNGYRQPVFCMGESNGHDEPNSGSMMGVFVFPKSRTDAGGTTRRQ
ncbi:hypothetical protein QTL95_11480 [Rhizobium sp. S152]|uniref:hypothetical protein n=1 Tax=Rhizobium sp. S152 TaxID=3055038 RepID=UPI0025A9ABD1|nr:hypothetical protein [Rhizobium sp. S152]MDM9626520.1 hypothetical protein [Rhizobium sp. S152]